MRGLRVIKRNARLRAEELDLLIRNDLATGFWRLAGSPLVVECKNWADKVGAREVTVLIDKLRTVGPESRTGVLVALNGVTGDFRRDAVLKIREARQAGRFVIVLEDAATLKVWWRERAWVRFSNGSTRTFFSYKRRGVRWILCRSKTK